MEQRIEHLGAEYTAFPKLSLKTGHCEGRAALHRQSVFIKDPGLVLWRRTAQWYYFATETSSVSSIPDVTNLNWKARWQQRVTQISMALKQASLIPPCNLFIGFFSFFISDLLQSVHHTYVRPTRGHKQGTAGAKTVQLQSIAYWPVTAGAIKQNTVESYADITSLIFIWYPNHTELKRPRVNMTSTSGTC